MRQKVYLVIFLFFVLKLSSQSFGGALSSGTVVCQGNNNGILTVTGFSGTIQRWEYSLAPSGPWTPLFFTSNSYNYINLIQSTYFRVVVQLTGFPAANSNTVLVSCDQPAVSGNISTNTFQCINTPVTCSLSGNTGSVIAWEFSTNNWITTNTITNSNTLIATLSSLTNTTQIRARVQNGVCPFIYTNTLNVIPAAQSNGGSIMGVQNVCSGNNSETLTLSNYTGAIQQWESSSSSGGPFNVVAASSGLTSLSYFNLTQSTWYRVLVKNGTCNSAYSPAFLIQVNGMSNGGSISGTQNVCAAFNSGTLQLLANTGSINQWEYSTNNGGSWNLINNNTSVQTFSNISVSRIYRAIVQSGLCPLAVSNQFTVNVNPAPTVTFNATNSCVNTSVQFTNLTNGSNSYSWDFGDGASAAIYNPIHLYTTAGTFTVKLTASSTQGCNDSLKKTVSVFPKPQVTLISPDTACFGSTLTFNSASSIITGSISSLKFTFNDGSPTTTIVPAQHYFLSEGVYSVYLSATSNMGCKDSALKQVTIYPKPMANFISANVCQGSAVLFNNLSFISSGGLQPSWNFGNGSTSNLVSPNYIYSSAGTYSVLLISISTHNCMDTAFKTVTINEKPDIKYTANSVCLGSPVVFTSTFTPSNVSVSVTINFGDGSYSNSANTAHHYLFSGTFASSIIAITDSGCVSTVSKNVTVYSKPLANFSFNNVCNADSVLFNNTSSVGNGAMHYFWDLSGVTSSTLNSPKHLYANSGTYSVVLIATTEFDCSDTIVKDITIFDAPKAQFGFSNACNGFPVTFTNNSTVNSGIITNSNWDFGDNSTANVVNPSKNYLNNGTYTVTLISTSSNGCSDTVKRQVNVYEGPVAKFSAESQCLNTAVNFTNLSILTAGSFSSMWRFGNETTSDKNSPFHVYSKSGTYQVWLKTTSSNFCVDSISRFIQIFSLPKVLAGKDTTIEKGLGIQLHSSGAKNFNWIPTFGLNNPTLSNPFANPDTTTTYIVEGYDENGCKGSDTIVVKITESFLVTPYNIVTPDHNGMNDTWIIKNIQAYKDNHVVIFDQWNQKVYEKKNYNNDWEGKNRSGELLPDATYYYILTFAKSSTLYKGYITLIRNK